MKILWLSHFIPYPPKGGVLQRGYHLIREVAKYHEVHLLAFNQRDLIRPFFNSVEDGVEQSKIHLTQFCKTMDVVDLPCDQSKWGKPWVALKSLFTREPYTMNWLQANSYAEAIQSKIAEEKFDFIHCDTISLAPYLKFCGDIPASLDHHNIESHMLIRRASKEANILKKAYYWQEGKRLKRSEIEYCPQFSFNFTCSDIDTDRLKEISKDSKVYTIPNGVDIDFFKPNFEIKKERRLIFIGRLNWYPNTSAVRFIVKDIWPLLKEKFPDLVIDIIGANPPQDVVDLAQQEERLSVHGFVDDLSYYFDTAIAYICPIKDGGGTKLKILDALACGKAIVADPIACEGINVTDNHNVVFAETPEQYVAAIERILSDDKLRENLEQCARDLAENEYSFESIGKALSDLYIKYAQTN